MTTQTTSPSTRTTADPTARSMIPVPSGYKDNLRYQQRTPGTGYGRSSGYARGRQYAQHGDGTLFRCG